MKEFKYVITDPVGIHARPAGLLVKEVSKYESVININKEGKQVSAKKIMAVMSLGVKQGNEVTVTVEGDDEEAATLALQNFFNENL